MKTKSVMFAVASVFALVLALGLASATITASNIVAPTSVEVPSGNQGSFTITFTLTNNNISTSLNWTGSTAVGSNAQVTVVPTSMADGSTSPVSSSATATVTYDATDAYALGNIVVNLQASYTDSSGPQILIFTPINVAKVDTTKPTITLNGSNPLYLKLGQSYTEYGAVVTDNYNSNLAATIVSSSVNTNAVGTYSVTYDAMDSSANAAAQVIRTVIVMDPAIGLCPVSSNSTGLSISKFEVTNKGKGSDTSWYPLDTIEIEVELTNNQATDLEDAVLELEIYKKGSTSNVINDMVWISSNEDKFDLGTIEAGDNAKHTFIFRVNPAEFTFSSSQDYEIKLKAYPDGKSAQTCIDFSSNMNGVYWHDVTIKPQQNDKAVVVDIGTLPSASAICGQQVTFTADVWNIGKKDFENRVSVKLVNSELGISNEQVILGDLDQGGKIKATFTFSIPKGMVEKQYDLEMNTLYDYDTDTSTYQLSSAESFIYPLTLTGCDVAEATVSASLVSGGKAGEELVVKATITNTGDETATYTLGLSGYSTWASNAKTDLSSFTLNAGASQEVVITLDVDKKALGEQSFSVELTSDGEIVLSQPVQVSIDKKGLDNTTLIILIVLISVAAIALIVTLIVKASR